MPSVQRRGSLLELVVGEHRQLLRYDHAPGVEDELFMKCNHWRLDLRA